MNYYRKAAESPKPLSYRSHSKAGKVGVDTAEDCESGRRVLVSILVPLVSSLNYIFIVVMPVNYIAWAQAFDSALWGC